MTLLGEVDKVSCHVNFFSLSDSDFDAFLLFFMFERARLDTFFLINFKVLKRKISHGVL